MADRNPCDTNGKRISPCCFIWIFGLIAALSFYTFRAIQFEGKVRTFSNKIEIGMGDLEALRLLGRYSRFEKDFDGYHYVVVYEGKLFFRDDIILTLDPSSRKVISKRRGRIYRFLSVDCP
jgi:hypothetical protein